MLPPLPAVPGPVPVAPPPAVPTLPPTVAPAPPVLLPPALVVPPGDDELPPMPALALAPPPPPLALVDPPLVAAPPPLPTLLLEAPPLPALALVAPPLEDVLPPPALEAPPPPELRPAPVVPALLWPPRLVEPALAPAAAPALPPVPGLPSALEFPPLQETSQPAAPIIRIAQPGNLCIPTPCGIDKACFLLRGTKPRSFSCARGRKWFTPGRSPRLPAKTTTKIARSLKECASGKRIGFVPPTAPMAVGKKKRLSEQGHEDLIRVRVVGGFRVLPEVAGRTQAMVTDGQ